MYVQLRKPRNKQLRHFNGSQSFIDSHYDTQEEKDVAMAKATEEANKAKALIDQATSNNDVDQAQLMASTSLIVLMLM